MTIVGVVAGQSDQKTVLYRAYTDAILRAGGIPVVIPAAHFTGPALREVLGHLDAVLLSGGGDIDPRHYGEKPMTTLDEVDAERDETELRTVAWCQETGRRVLGICRGAQLLAVANGGTLVQDLPAAGYEPHMDPRHDRGYAAMQHPIKVLPDTLTSRVLDGVAEVNSHHHQAVDDPGRLTATAWTGDGVIEAIEGDQMLGVQWHPEFLISGEKAQLRPFQWLVHGEGGWE